MSKKKHQTLFQLAVDTWQSSKKIPNVVLMGTVSVQNIETCAEQ